MKNYEVVLDKRTTVDDWCIYDERDIKRYVDHTVAVICAFNEDRLKQKLEKLYPGIRVIRYKEV